jgi:hypothetical protein
MGLLDCLRVLDLRVRRKRWVADGKMTASYSPLRPSTSAKSRRRRISLSAERLSPPQKALLGQGSGLAGQSERIDFIVEIVAVVSRHDQAHPVAQARQLLDQKPVELQLVPAGIGCPGFHNPQTHGDTLLLFEIGIQINEGYCLQFGSGTHV